MAKQIKTEISDMLTNLQEFGWSQTEIASELGVSQAYVSLLKYKKIDTEIIKRNEIKEKLIKIDKEYGLNLNTAEDEFEVSEEDTDENTYSDWLNAQIIQNNLKAVQLADASRVSPLTIQYILSGKTSNPQMETREKIEKGLQILLKEKPDASVAVPEVILESSPPKIDNEEIVSGILFVDSEINQSPNKKGIYVIHDRRGYPTYVGKGNIKNRLLKHLQHRAFLDNRVAHSFSYLVIQKNESKEDIEKANIEALKLEKIILKFCGNTILLNKQLVEDLSDD